jgi:hypothetical protein
VAAVAAAVVAADTRHERPRPRTFAASGPQVAGRKSQVAGRKSQVASRGSQVAGRGSRVAGRGSRVFSRAFRGHGRARFRAFHLRRLCAVDGAMNGRTVGQRVANGYLPIPLKLGVRCTEFEKLPRRFDVQPVAPMKSISRPARSEWTDALCTRCWSARSNRHVQEAGYVAPHPADAWKLP